MRQNLLSLEIETAHKWDHLPDITYTVERNWLTLPRPTKALLVANEQLRNLTAAIEAHEEKVKAQMSRAK